jgi:hypothetical protein
MRNRREHVSPAMAGGHHFLEGKRLVSILTNSNDKPGIELS